MNKTFEYEDGFGDVASLTERGDGNVFLGVRESTDGLIRSVIVPRAALIEWLNDGKPETCTAIVVTDEMAEAAADAGIQPGEFRLAYRGEADRKRLVRIARDMLTAALAAGQVPVWEPCEREDIRKGDRVRVEFSTGNTVEEYTAVDDHSFDNSSRGARWFRIPAPVETAEWPKGRAGDLFRVDYTNQNGERRQDVLMYMYPSRDVLFALERLFTLHKQDVDDPDSPVTLHKVIRRKDVDA